MEVEGVAAAVAVEVEPLIPARRAGPQTLCARGLQVGPEYVLATTPYSPSAVRCCSAQKPPPASSGRNQMVDAASDRLVHDPPLLGLSRKYT